MDARAGIPGVDRLLEAAEAAGLTARHPAGRVKAAIRAAVDRTRAAIAAGTWAGDPEDPAGYLEAAERWLAEDERPSLAPVINATGVVLHTNLGRAPLAAVAREAMGRIAAGYSNLEFDVAEGVRGSRYAHCAALVCELTGAEDALVVNNCAGALVLALSALAGGSDVVVSRGELVEIGGGFRIPEIVRQAGAGLREVGATNRTRLEDYRAAVRAGGVAGLLKVHRSNFRIEGFTEESGLAELAELAGECGIPLVHDLGSGLLADAASLGLPPEPTPAESLRDGADLVVFSGDKLLGGPQAGIVAGRRELVARLRSSPLCRALRVDKATLAGLEATLRLYRDPERALTEIPALSMLATPLGEVKIRAERLVAGVAEAAAAVGWVIRATEGTGRVGGGTYPGHHLPSWTVRVGGGKGSADALCRSLRLGDPPLVARVEDDELVLDLRTVRPAEEADVARRLSAVLAGDGGPR